MRRIWVMAALAAAAANAACVLIRDFDELQGGARDDVAPGAEGGAAGSTNEVGGAGASGGAGGAECDCDDNNPCTRDTCDAAGECRHYSNGVILDGLSAAVTDSNAQALTLAGNPQGFYAAITAGDNADSQVTLYSFGREDTEPITGPGLAEQRIIGASALRAVPGAAVALRPEREVPFNVEVVAALTNAPSGEPLQVGQLASVWQITLDANLRPPASPAVQRLSPAAQDDYVVGQRGPVAWRHGNTHAAWIGAGFTDIHVTTNRQRATTLGDGSSLVGAIAPLANTSLEPGVLWLSADSPGQVYTQIAGDMTPDPLDACPMPGEFIAAHTSELRAGLWVGSWTSATRDSSGEIEGVYGQLQLIGCGDATGCAIALDEAQTLDCTEQPSAGTYDAVTGILTSLEESGIVYEALLVPQVLGAEESAVYLQVVRLDFNDLARSTLLFAGSGREVARVGSDGALGSPAVAFSGTDRLAVAWIETNPANGRGEAHFERYRLCRLTADDLRAGQ